MSQARGIATSWVKAAWACVRVRVLCGRCLSLLATVPGRCSGLGAVVTDSSGVVVDELPRAGIPLHAYDGAVLADHESVGVAMGIGASASQKLPP